MCLFIISEFVIDDIVSIFIMYVKQIFCGLCMRFFSPQKKDPKAVLRLSELNVAFAPQKTGNLNSLNLTFIKDGSTRHIYVYHDDSAIIVNWYMAIRCAKLHRLQVAYPSANESEV
jgi:hypothetical protein